MSLERKQENTNKKDKGLCDQCQESVCAEKRESVSIIKKRGV